MYVACDSRSSSRRVDFTKKDLFVAAGGADDGFERVEIHGVNTGGVPWQLVHHLARVRLVRARVSVKRNPDRGKRDLL